MCAICVRTVLAGKVFVADDVRMFLSQGLFHEPVVKAAAQEVERVQTSMFDGTTIPKP